MLNVVKGAFQIIVYGVLLSIGFRLGQKVYEYGESGKLKEHCTQGMAFVQKVYSSKLKRGIA